MTTEEAVSPVIGVILMVAITVILAAVIAAFVFGMAGTSTTTKTVGAQLTLNQSDSQHVNLMFTGGADLPALTYFTVSYDGAVVDPIDAATADTVSKADQGTVTSQVVPTTGNKFAVGEVVWIDVGKEITGHKITIIGGFNDGSNQILLDRTL